MPDGVTHIGECAFWGCANLETVIVGENVKSIDTEAFYLCEKINTVYYEGDEDTWNEIYFGVMNHKLTDATRYYYSESEPTEEGNFWRYVDGVPTVWVKAEE